MAPMVTMNFNLSESLIFAGTATILCAIMTVFTPKFAESLSDIARIGATTIVLFLLGILLFVIGMSMRVL